MKTIKNFFSPQHWLDKPAPVNDPTDFVGKKLDDHRFQTHCDVLVIGGGGVGSSVAYWLKKTAREGLNVCVVEKDDTVCWYPTVNSCKFQPNLLFIPVLSVLHISLCWRPAPTILLRREHSHVAVWLRLSAQHHTAFGRRCRR